MKLSTMEENVFASAVEALKNVRSEDGTILTKPFLDLCKQLLPLIDNFGSSMACVRADVASNITKLENRYFSNPSAYTYLYTIANEEIASKSARNSSSCTNALVWLNRSMDFMVQLFRNLLERPELSMTQACSDAYKKTLKKWHGWMAVSTFKVILKMGPEKKKFMDSIGANSDVNADIEMLCRTFAPVLEENHKFLSSIGVNDLKAP